MLKTAQMKVHTCMPKTSMRVSPETIKTLKKLKKDFKAKSYDEAIGMVAHEHEEFGDLQERINKLETSINQHKVPTESTKPIEAPETSKPLSNDFTNTSKKTITEAPTPTPTEAGEPSIKSKAPVPVETPPHHKCTFRTMGPDDLVHCSKDYDRKNIIHRVTDNVCTQCWDRIMSKRQETQALAKA